METSLKELDTIEEKPLKTVTKEYLKVFFFLGDSIG